jgi:hypothetical protein
MINSAISNFLASLSFSVPGANQTTVQSITGKAGGGSFAGWAMVGDAPGGRMTPYTEYVYAPHGATVFNQAQMHGGAMPAMSGGGTIRGGHTINVTINNPTGQTASGSFDNAMLKLSALGVL